MTIYSAEIIEKMERVIRREQRVVRIFKKHGPALQARSIALSSDGDGTVTLSCPSSEKANWAATLLGLPQPEYFYIGHKASKEAVIEDGDIEFHFYANDVRQIHFDVCRVKRQRRQAGMARRAWLYFNDWEIAEMQYLPDYTKHEEMKKKLWAIAKKKLECDLRYELVD